MASIITSAAKSAHAAAATLLEKAQAKPGDKIPVSVTVKEQSPAETTTLDLTGRNILAFVPGAFTPPCSSEVPGYIDNYEAFKAKGVKNIYIIAVNDAFVMNAWKAKLAPNGTQVRFIGDDQCAERCLHPPHPPSLSHTSTMPSSVSTLAYSPRASPLGSPTAGSPSRRVQTRKGSICAGDPWGTHSQLNLNPSRSTSCKLTIVRVNEPPVHLDETPPSPQQRRHHGFGGHRRQGSGGSIHSNSSIGGGNKSDAPSRISFAGNSFVPPGSSRDGNGSRPTSPVMNRPRSPGGGHHHRSSTTSSNKPRLSPDELVTLARQTCTPSAPIHAAPSPGATKQPGTSPASFTALPDEFFLPFIDRAAEVSSLFSGPPSAKLLTLLEQTFSTSPVSSPVSQSESTSPSLDVFAVDPKRWTFSQLEHWLKHIDRDQAPDPYWVASARRCVLAHSELIWERLKGALGVPPELDESDFEELGDVINVIPDMDFVAPERGDNADQATGLVDEVLAGSMSPEFSHIAEHRAATEDIPEADLAPSLSIEPVLAPTSPQPPSADHPPTRMGAHRMTDISEDIREENEEEGEGGSGSGLATAVQSPPSEVIQGLRISTVPASPSILASSSPSARRLSLSASPLPPMAALPTDRISPLVIDEQRRDGSQSPEKDGQHSRDSSPVVGMGGRVGSGWNYAASTGSAGSDSVYDAVAERGPGNPLFPTSFARLALGPTLQANNPSMRSPTAPPPPMFGNNPHAIRMAMRGRRALPSWAEGWDPLKHEYALTLASGSSVGGY